MEERDRKQYHALQDRLRSASHRAREYRYALKKKYGESWLAPRSMRERLERMDDRATMADQTFFNYLCRISPRGDRWRSEIPWSWIVEHLTYEDATTAGPLSCTPPVAYGGSPASVRNFAQQHATVA